MTQAVYTKNPCGEITRQRDRLLSKGQPERTRDGEVHAGVLPQRLARDRTNARGQEIEEHEHEGPTRRGEATQHGPEDERRKYFHDGGDHVPAVNEKAKIERVRSREHER